MTLCFELQQSHEMDYVLRDEVYTRYLRTLHGNGVTWGVYIKQILYIQGKLCSAVQICNLR